MDGIWQKIPGMQRPELRAWALYDWGNSAFATIMMTAVLPIYFADVAAADLPANMRTATWGYTTSAALVFISILGPVLGNIADSSGRRLRMLALFTGLGVVASGLMAMVGQGDWLLASLLFVAGNIGFAGGEIFYEALLPHICSRDEVNRVSTTGFALGYLGGGVLLAISLVLIQMPETFGLADAGVAVRLSFIAVALWWGFFSVPLFRRIREPARPDHPHAAGIIPAFRQLWKTLKEITRYRDAFLFLVAFWAYSDGIGTIIKMATVYGKEVGIGTSDMIGAILFVQFFGIPCAFFFGWLGDKWGEKKGLYLTLVVYTLITVLAWFMTTGWQFWILAGGIGFVQGGAQALSRSIYSRLIPAKRSAEFFGFYSASSRFAGIIGPLAFGLMGQFGGGGRNAVIMVAFLFIAGMLLLAGVDTERGYARAAAGD